LVEQGGGRQKGITTPPAKEREREKEVRDEVGRAVPCILWRKEGKNRKVPPQKKGLRPPTLKADERASRGRRRGKKKEVRALAEKTEEKKRKREVPNLSSLGEKKGEKKGRRGPERVSEDRAM